MNDFKQFRSRIWWTWSLFFSLPKIAKNQPFLVDVDPQKSEGCFGNVYVIVLWW